MSVATPFFRVAAVVFAVLMAGIYVFAKAGGTLPGTSAGNPPSSPHATFPGSKFGSIARPQDFAPPQSTAPAFQKTSQSAATMAKPTAAQQTEQRQAERPTTAFPGSKSAIIFTPPESQPAPPTGNAPSAGAVPASPTGHAPGASPTAARNSTRAIPPSAPANPAGSSPAPRAQPTARTIMPGSKSAPVIGPEVFAPATANQPSTTPSAAQPAQSYVPQAKKSVPQPPSPQQSMKKAVNSWINPPAQRAASR